MTQTQIDNNKQIRDEHMKIPDWSEGDVIAAYDDGTIVLDDGITTWNPERAREFLERRVRDYGSQDGLSNRS